MHHFTDLGQINDLVSRVGYREKMANFRQDTRGGQPLARLIVYLPVPIINGDYQFEIWFGNDTLEAISSTYYHTFPISRIHSEHKYELHRYSVISYVKSTLLNHIYWSRYNISSWCAATNHFAWLLHQMETFSRYWPFVREFTGPRWLPCTKASDMEFWCFLWSASE